MDAPPCREQHIAPFPNHPQDAPRLPLVAADNVTQVHASQLDDDDPTRPDDMHMRWRVVVGVDDDPYTLDEQYRRHRCWQT
jgi:hypothetical protein